MNKKQIAIYRPVFTAPQILLLTQLVETYRNSAILETDEEVMIAELHLKLKKEEVKASVGVGSAYLLKSEDERTRAKPTKVTFETLGGTKSDRKKLAAMSDKEQEIVFAKATFDITQNKEELDATLAEIAIKYATVLNSSHISSQANTIATIIPIDATIVEYEEALAILAIDHEAGNISSEQYEIEVGKLKQRYFPAI